MSTTDVTASLGLHKNFHYQIPTKSSKVFPTSSLSSSNKAPTTEIIIRFINHPFLYKANNKKLRREFETINHSLPKHVKCMIDLINLQQEKKTDNVMIITDDGIISNDTRVTQ